MSASPKLRADERAPAHSPAIDRHEPPESLAARYARMAHRGFEPRLVDGMLRGLDIAVSLVALLLLSPILLLTTAAVRMASGSPVLYRGSRVGRAGRIFTMYKFRTLTPDAEVRLGPYLGEELTLRTRTEMTTVGKVLRATHFDELPQLINVLVGDMAIVGPRPIRPAFFEELCEQVPQYWQRLVVRPGMTGFAQLRVTREMSWAEKLAHDLEYIADRSIGLYLRVVAATAWRVATRFVQGLRALLRGRR
jgi:lipopolysaccharide/colanic/teichoic acid biosynthesis glycosyltransferase